jgi:hypothetical protein
VVEVGNDLGCLGGAALPTVSQSVAESGVKLALELAAVGQMSTVGCAERVLEAVPDPHRQPFGLPVKSYDAV